MRGAQRVETQQLILKDTEGHARAALTIEHDGPRLTLLDAQGRRRAVLAAGPEAAGIFFYDRRGQKRAWLGTDERGGKTLAIWDAEGRETFSRP